MVCHLSRCVSRVYGNEPPHEHHRRPLLANARKRDATHEERLGLSIPLGPVWSRVWSCLGRCHFVVESLIGGWGRAAPTRSGSRHERRKYRQIAHHAPLRLSRLDPPATAAPIARLLPKPAMLGHDAGAFAGRALRVRGGVQPMNAGGPGGLQLQLRDVGIDYREALLAEHHAIGQAQPVVSRPAARNSLIRLP